MMLVKRSPGAQVVPAEVRTQAKNVRTLLAFRGPWLENSIINTDVFALRIKPLEGRGELARAIIGSNFLQQCSGLRQVLSECVRQGFRAPQKHSAVPKKIPR